MGLLECGDFAGLPNILFMVVGGDGGVVHIVW